MTNLAEQITQAYKLEQQGNLKAIKPSDIPVSYEAISPEWLTHILCKDYPEAKVIKHRLDVADDGNTNRRRIFITYNDIGNAAKLPTSVFCKASYNLDTRLQNAMGGLIQGEDMFYNEYLQLLDINAPTCFLSTYDRVSYNSILMLDDLEPKGAVFCNHDTQITRVRAESQISLLAKLHGRYYDKPEANNAKLPAFEDVFNNIDQWWGFEKLCADGFMQAEEVIPPKLYKQHSKIWPTTLQSVALHAQLPRTLTHNDVHLRNWYIAENGQMVLCDWQCFGKGHWARDFAYAISTSLTVENRRAWEKELLQHYLDQFNAQSGANISFDQAWTYYRQHLFSALSFWTSTLAVVVTQPRDATLEFIKRITTTIDDLDALNSFT